MSFGTVASGPRKVTFVAIQTPYPSLDPASLDDLSATLRGPLFRPGEHSYDDARKVFNAMIDRRPAAIVHAADAEDVQRTVTFARANNLPVSIEGSNHNVAGSAVSDSGLMQDSSSMGASTVDAERRVAVAGAGRC